MQNQEKKLDSNQTKCAYSIPESIAPQNLFSDEKNDGKK
jgi:hypothetical protein